MLAIIKIKAKEYFFNKKETGKIITIKLSSQQFQVINYLEKELPYEQKIMLRSGCAGHSRVC